MTLGHSYAVG